MDTCGILICLCVLWTAFHLNRLRGSSLNSNLDSGQLYNITRRPYGAQSLNRTNLKAYSREGTPFILEHYPLHHKDHESLVLKTCSHPEELLPLSNYNWHLKRITGFILPEENMTLKDFFAYLKSEPAFISSTLWVSLLRFKRLGFPWFFTFWEIVLRPFLSPPYLSDINVDDWCPALREMDFLRDFLLPSSTPGINLFWGAKGSSAYPMHMNTDLQYDVLMLALEGEKLLMIFDAKYGNLLNPFKVAGHQVYGTDAIENALPANVVGYTARLRPGDILFLPGNTIHQVVNTDYSMALIQPYKIF